MHTPSQQLARPLPRFGQPDLRSQQEKHNRLQHLKSRVIYQLKDYDLVDSIVASIAPLYHRLQMLVGINADYGYCALLKREDCNIVGNGQLLCAINSFVPELATAIDSFNYNVRAEALKNYLRHDHDHLIRSLLQQLFAGDLKRNRKSTTQAIYVRSTCAGCLRQVSGSFKQGPMCICKHCLPLWCKTSERYMSQHQVDEIWLGLPIDYMDSCIVDTSFTAAAIPAAYHTNKIQKLAPQIHGGLSLNALLSEQHDRGQLAINYIQAILARSTTMKEGDAETVRSGLARLYDHANALDVFNMASIHCDALEKARSVRFQQHPTMYALRQLVADGGSFLSQSVVGPKQVRNALELFEQSMTGQKYCYELILEAIDYHQGIARPDLLDYLTSVIKHGIEVGAIAYDILSHTNDQVVILLEDSARQTMLNTADETWNEWLTLLANQHGPFNRLDPIMPPISSTEMCIILDHLLSTGLPPEAMAKLWIHLAIGGRMSKTIDAWIPQARQILAGHKIVLRVNKAENIPNPAWIDELIESLDVGQNIQAVRGPDALDPGGSIYISPSGNLAVYPLSLSNMGME